MVGSGKSSVVEFFRICFINSPTVLFNLQGIGKTTVKTESKGIRKKRIKSPGLLVLLLSPGTSRHVEAVCLIIPEGNREIIISAPVKARTGRVATTTRIQCAVSGAFALVLPINSAVAVRHLPVPLFAGVCFFHPLRLPPCFPPL